MELKAMIAAKRIATCTRNLRQKLQLNNYFSSKVPGEPTWVPIDKEKLPKVPELDEAMVNHIERLSLVKFNNQAGVERLYKAIEYANQLHMVDTEGVEPLDSVLENRSVYLRDDKVTDGNCLKDILQNASQTVEDYFVAPPDGSQRRVTTWSTVIVFPVLDPADWVVDELSYTIGYTWRPVLMVEEEPKKIPKRTTNPQEATGKLSHIPTLAASDTQTQSDRGNIPLKSTDRKSLK